MFLYIDPYITSLQQPYYTEDLDALIRLDETPKPVFRIFEYDMPVH